MRESIWRPRTQQSDLCGSPGMAHMPRQSMARSRTITARGLALARETPESRAIMNPGTIAIPQVGGLHRRYEPRTARRHDDHTEPIGHCG
jgi:hypothetical protein